MVVGFLVSASWTLTKVSDLVHKKTGGPRRADTEVLHRKMRVVGVAEPDPPAA